MDDETFDRRCRWALRAVLAWIILGTIVALLFAFCPHAAR